MLLTIWCKDTPLTKLDSCMLQRVYNNGAAYNY